MQEMLALVLRPGPSSQRIYRAALFQFAPLISAVEETWQSLKRPKAASAFQNGGAVAQVDPLANFFRPELLRCERMLRDLRVLSGLGDEEIEVRVREPIKPQAQELVKHITHVGSREPAVLGIYARMLYSNLVTRAPWVGAQLMLARDERWRINPHTLPAATSPAEAGLEMWFFPTNRPLGTDLRLRWNAFERGLSEEQRDEVVREEAWFLRSCMELAEDLNAEMQKSTQADPSLLGAGLSSLAWMISTLPFLLARWVERLLGRSSTPS